MFKLIKINNSSSNVPQLERFSQQGCFGKMRVGGAVKEYGKSLTSALNFPNFIVAKAPETDKDDILCYRVTEDMIFKTKVVSMMPAEVGDYVITSSNTDYINGVEVNEIGEGRVIAIDDDGEHIYVKFDRRREIT